MNNKEEKLKKILFDIINKLSKDADVYHHNGSLWLIHTEDRKWIVEFTKEQILWFNYNFFRSAFKFVSLDINDKNEYVTEWFESRFLDKPKVEDTNLAMNNYSEDIVDAIQNGVKYTYKTLDSAISHVEDAIQNGVKDTFFDWYRPLLFVEDTIQNGVKGTFFCVWKEPLKVEDTIQNGVKHTIAPLSAFSGEVEDTIQNGVKHTKGAINLTRALVEDTIQNGVKDTKPNGILNRSVVEDTIQNGVKETLLQKSSNLYRIEDTIQNGVKLTEKSLQIDGSCVIEDVIQNGVKDTKPMDEWVNAESIIEDTIEYGVKELQPLPAQDGNRDWGNYYRGKEDRTKPFNEYLDEAIRFGVKEVIEEHHHRRREVVVTIKDGVKETHQDCSNNIARVEGIIRVGEKLD